METVLVLHIKGQQASRTQDNTTYNCNKVSYITAERKKILLMKTEIRSYCSAVFHTNILAVTYANLPTQSTCLLYLKINFREVKNKMKKDNT